MHPSSGENLPTPQFEAPSPAASGSEIGLDQARENVHQAETGGETAVGQQQQPVATPPNQALTQPAQVPATNTTQPTDQTASVTASLAATDVNLIEKPWVESTKKVVKATKDDPYRQKREVSKIQVDYMKKRFNKAIPLEDTT